MEESAMLRCRAFFVLFVCLIALLAKTAAAQYSNVATPFHNVGDSYFERFGLGLSGNIGNNVFFNTGGVTTPCHRSVEAIPLATPALDSAFAAAISGSIWSARPAQGIRRAPTR
jgi:hypothetical protein